MKLSKRMVIFGFFLLVILFVGLIFWPFILDEILKPISLVVWLLLRITVLSIDQQIYWIALIIVVLYVSLRLLFRDQSIVSSTEVFISNETTNSINHWRALFSPIDRSKYDDDTLKREFTHRLVLFYATKQHTSANMQIMDALRRGELPIPERLHGFLFSEETQKTRFSLKGLAISIRKAIRNWIRRWSGQQKAEHYRMIDEIISFMETSLEMKNDDEKFNPNQH